jgi:hypothetical protein
MFEKKMEMFMSDTIIAVSTSVPGVYASTDAFSLAERFFSCPAAAKRLDSEEFIKPILIDSQNIPGPKSDIDYDKSNYNPKRATILIPEKHLPSTKALTGLAFEIFNIKKSAANLNKQANLGDMGMDSFAMQKEDEETRDAKEHFKLIKQCAKPWKLSPKEVEEYMGDYNVSLEVTRFRDEIMCHTDRYRQQWIDLFQKNYCKKHPSDSRSCETKKKDLCDHDQLISMSRSKQLDIAGKRACKMLPQADESVKKDPFIRGLLQEACPEALRKSTKQPMKKDL